MYVTIAAWAGNAEGFVTAQAKLLSRDMALIAHTRKTDGMLFAETTFIDPSTIPNSLFPHAIEEGHVIFCHIALWLNACFFLGSEF